MLPEGSNSFKAEGILRFAVASLINFLERVKMSRLSVCCSVLTPLFVFLDLFCRRWLSDIVKQGWLDKKLPKISMVEP